MAKITLTPRTDDDLEQFGFFTRSRCEQYADETMHSRKEAPREEALMRFCNRFCAYSATNGMSWLAPHCAA